MKGRGLQFFRRGKFAPRDTSKQFMLKCSGFVFGAFRLPEHFFKKLHHEKENIFSRFNPDYSIR